MKLLITLTLLLSCIGQAFAANLFIVLSDDTDAYHQASQEVIQSLKQTTVSLTPQVVLLAQFSTDKVKQQDLVITIGNAAAQQIHLSSAVIYSFSEQQVLPLSIRNWVAPVISQPISRLVKTITPIIKNQYKNKILLAVSEDNSVALSQIHSILSSNNMLEVIELADNEKPAKYIEESLFNAGALVAINDQHIWRGENARWMLYQAYRYKVPVIGHSQNFLKAGALVSVYSTLKQIAATTSEQVAYWQTNGKLKQSGVIYSDYNIEFNKNIARALNIEVPANHFEVKATQ